MLIDHNFVVYVKALVNKGGLRAWKMQIHFNVHYVCRSIIVHVQRGWRDTWLEYHSWKHALISSLYPPAINDDNIGQWLESFG